MITTLMLPIGCIVKTCQKEGPALDPSGFSPGSWDLEGGTFSLLESESELDEEPSGELYLGGGGSDRLLAGIT